MRPMLAAKIREDQLKRLYYPVIVSPKIDGIRCLIDHGIAMSRTGKHIRNLHVQSLAKKLPHGLDGELTFGLYGIIKSFRDTTSNIMSREGSSDFTYNVFDSFSASNMPFTDRQSAVHFPLEQRCASLLEKGLVQVVEQVVCLNPKDILLYERKYLDLGYEGMILRKPNASYKFGRSTLKEQKLLKLKRFKDGEARIIGFVELLHNANPAVLNELGYKDHSKHKDNLVPMNTLGALIVRNKEGVEFQVGSGFTEAERLRIWQGKILYRGDMIKYKYFSTSGDYDKPRHPIFLGFRSTDDF